MDRRTSHFCACLSLPLAAVLTISLLTPEVALTEVTTIGTVAIEALRLPNDRIDVTLAGAEKSCVCHSACFVTACRCYSLVRGLDGVLDCLISLTPVPRHLLLPDANAKTIFKTNYYPHGERFYQVLDPTTRSIGIKQCTADEAQVAVVDTDEKTKELLSVMLSASLTVVRVGLFMDNSESVMTPRWELFNGTTIDATNITLSSNSVQCFTLTRTDGGSTMLENVWNCGVPLHVICQRDY